MSDNDKNAKFEAAVDAMAEHRFYDVTIVCTTDDYQADFWMTKLSQSIPKGSSSHGTNFPMVIAVSEDWTDPSGAGNGLGTLYAWRKACRYAAEKFDGVDLDTLLRDGKISAALYHTAGKGTRLAPLPASENNNKPGVVSLTSIFLDVCLLGKGGDGGGDKDYHTHNVADLFTIFAYVRNCHFPRP